MEGIAAQYAKLIETAKLPPVVQQIKSTDVACSMDFFVQRAVYWRKRLFATKRVQHSPKTPSVANVGRHDDIKVNPGRLLKRRRCNGCSNAYVNSGLPSIIPQSLPWSDKEIRLVDATPKGVLSEYSWKKIEKEIRQGHLQFLKETRKKQQQSVVDYMIKSVSYCKDKMCAVIEVAGKGDASKIRNELIPFLQLPVKIKAMLNSDKPFPVVTTVACPDYDVYSTEDFIEMMKMVNPILDKELFEVVETVLKDSGGRQLFIRTSTKVVQYIREKGYVLELAVGETIFDKRIEFVAGQYVYSKEVQ